VPEGTTPESVPPIETPSKEFDPDTILRAIEPPAETASPIQPLDTGNALPSAPPQSKKASVAAGEFTYSVPRIDNDTSAVIDAAAMLQELPAITLSDDGPVILILHTHGSEAYAGTDGYRTLDRTLDVVRVGDALGTELQNRGYNVIHDRECYDYPAYNGSYNRSAEAAKAWIEKYPTIQIVFDIHRDSLELPDGTPKATYCEAPDGGRSAQVMIIATNGDKGLSHPNWQENMKFALRLQSAAEALHEGLMRPLVVSGQRYNEHLAPGYLLLEVGSTGNTIEEAVTGVRLFADSLEVVLRDLA
ncbi:MAG: stage II sporulation protein P, partial [Oscillospiraceae bacterium]|jgi:stage II sporulation protein P|nr:stage II sporulation protein P [Oscillospiraceae bacterium]